MSLLSHIHISFYYIDQLLLTFIELSITVGLMYCDVAARKALSLPKDTNNGVDAHTATTVDTDMPPVNTDRAQYNLPVKNDRAQSNFPVKTDLDIDMGVIGGYSIALPPFLSPVQRDARTSAFAVGAAGADTASGGDLVDNAAEMPLLDVTSSTAVTTNETKEATNTTTTATTTGTATTTTNLIATSSSPSIVSSTSSRCPSSMAPSMARLALHYTRSIRLLQLIGSCTTPRDVLFHLLASVKWLVRAVGHLSINYYL